MIAARPAVRRPDPGAALAASQCCRAIEAHQVGWSARIAASDPRRRLAAPRLGSGKGSRANAAIKPRPVGGESSQLCRLIEVEAVYDIPSGSGVEASRPAIPPQSLPGQDDQSDSGSMARISASTSVCSLAHPAGSTWNTGSFSTSGNVKPRLEARSDGASHARFAPAAPILWAGFRMPI